LVELFTFEFGIPFHIMKPTLVYSRVFSKAMIFALLALVAFQPDPAIAKIYKYKDEHGKTHFTDDPSSIPMRYRKKGSMRKFRGVAEPTPGVSASSRSSGEKSKAKEDKGLSSRDVTLIKQTIQVFGVGVALGKRYKNIVPNFPNGQGAINAIQSGLPLKEGLASELKGTKVPELQGALGFLKQSISVDQQTTSIGAGLTTRIAGILTRLVSEGEQQATMIKGLEKALKDSEKKKVEAKKKKEEEAKKEKEEAAKKKKEEEAKRKAEELIKE
jgi:hypothetical protein